MENVQCDFCERVFIEHSREALLKIFGHHLREKHFDEMVALGRKAKAIKNHRFNGVADYILINKKEKQQKEKIC